MHVPEPTTTTSRAVITTFVGLAIIFTVFRLVYRFRIRRFWWDDAWASVALIFQFMLVVAFWIRTDVPGVGPLNQSKHNRIIAYWILTNGFTCVLWSARLSMLYSIIRITPPMMRLRRVAYCCGILFVAMWAGLLAQKLYICISDLSWQLKPAPQCHLGQSVAILELVTDFSSDAILIVLPLRLLWGVNLPRHMRKLLFSIFSASCLVTIVSTIHATFLLGPAGLLEGLTANVEASVSLIVANLAVIVTHVYRLLRNGEDIDHSAYDVTTNGTRRINGPLKGFVKAAASSMHFASGIGGNTTRGTEAVLDSTTFRESRSNPDSNTTFGSVYEMTKPDELDHASTHIVNEPMIFANKARDLEPNC
ncbi:hypothetical protein FIBSPDRAFT_783324 [Athelia psychrophila]|uniref:Rhodopsin domain-containing protein n=1 Tax=Athelia psychrophila TaxID=1759441 RepID=A0A166NSY2_9AGAM|nr:hypothetical protein FIBSPDRAFT_783324 [Fibularhizoctonia sp. CBS 109695]